MATFHRCDNCQREQPGPLQYKLQLNDSYATLSDGPDDKEFCSLPCISQWIGKQVERR